ncbi:hypothetical protein ACTA71_004350 [Dictyostelium dimigraforme]
MAKTLTKKPTKKSKSSSTASTSHSETPKPTTVGFFQRIRANKTLGNIIVGSANLVCFTTRKVLNMTWITVTFAALFLTPAYKCISAELEENENEKGSDNPDSSLPDGIID